MVNVKVIAELGSCHMGKLDRLKEAIDRTKELNLYALKVQLFPNQAPYVPTNIHLSQDLFKLAFDYAEKRGVNLTASVFDMESYYFLRNFQPIFIKFAYGKKDQTWMINDAWNHKIETIVSCDVMSDHLVPKEAYKLYCVPEYPVRYEVAFDELFPRFDGFSDHTLGLRQTKNAIKAGAKIVEKHVKLGYEDEVCPDARFAVNIEDLAKLKV